jgi:hypothetical protein
MLLQMMFDPSAEDLAAAERLNGLISPLITALGIKAREVFELNNFPDMKEVHIRSRDFITRWDRYGRFEVEYIGKTHGVVQESQVNFDRLKALPERAHSITSDGHTESIRERIANANHHSNARWQEVLR